MEKDLLPERVKFSRQNKILCLIVCIGLLFGLLLKLFVFEILTVSGESMFPAIKDGERLFVSKCAYGLCEPYGDKLLLQWKKPKSGDVVIYLYNNKIVVKRCVALGGDKLEILRDSDYNYILQAGDFSIPLSQIQYLNLKDSSSVPEGYILAVGDNHAVSVDSRSYGFVSERNILGKVLCK
ncbi:signal peptidase I [uncultured Treponema sp.]|uniref:signal peptidase I n=1 Tax=uncultured Treponema sp. TaxID=162155 RepID=UPI0025CCF9C0|nr:signal peptidase I [uncultured Treponema sp.]